MKAENTVKAEKAKNAVKAANKKMNGEIAFFTTLLQLDKNPVT